MKRRLYIITGKPYNGNQSILFKKFAQLYKTFFSDKSGGAYENEEITLLEQPTTSELKAEIENTKADFGIIVMIGHGATKNDNQLFHINDTEIIKAGQFDLNIDKQIVILESCRSENSNVFPVDLSDKPPKFELGGTYRNPLSREKTKEIYFEEIDKCEKGLAVCLACSPNQEASNFYYSSSLLQIGKDWHLSSQRHLQVMKINELMFSTTIEVLNKSNNKQKPQMIGVKEFPFVISKF